MAESDIVDRTAGAYGDPFDPAMRPELYNGVLSRRLLAFAVDAFLIAILTLIAGVFVFMFGIVTLGIGWLIYPVLWQTVALLYVAFTLGGPAAATPGMRLVGVTMRLWHGSRPDWPIAAMHALLFWVSIVLLTPRKQLLHDLALGTLVVDATQVRSIARASRPLSS